MSTGFKAEHLSVREIFLGSDDLRMPPYQRGYSWGEKEGAELLNDLREACAAERPYYFLGAIVIVQTRAREPMEIVDGQQRLATLSILFSVLRDMAESRDEANRLHEMLEAPGKLIGNDRQRWRLTLNHIDTPFFRDAVQRRDATKDIDLYETTTESRQHIQANAQVFRDGLANTPASERMALARYVMNYCVLVRVTVADRDGGYAAFRVLNERGKKLAAHDILKSDLFERAGFSDAEAEAHSQTWNEIGSRLGSSGFDDLLKQIRSLFDRSSKEDMVTGFRNHVLPHMPARVFIEDRLQRYAENYEILSGLRKTGSDFPQKAIHHINHLRALDHYGWRAPALKYLVDGDRSHDATVAFFEQLERLAYMLQFVVQDRDARLRRYKRVIADINNGVSPDDESSALQLKSDEKPKLAERLKGRFATFRQRRAMSLRINALVEDGISLSPDSDSTLEHILPRNPKAGSDWLILWPSAGVRRELVDCLGNFTLLTNAENQEADRKEYSEKKALFFRNGKPSHHLSTSLRTVEEWSPEVVKKRRDAFVELLCKAWKLPIPD